jgi:hypothetical protein
MRRRYDYLSKLDVQVHEVCDWAVAMDPKRLWIDQVRAGRGFTRHRIVSGSMASMPRSD